MYIWTNKTVILKVNVFNVLLCICANTETDRLSFFKYIITDLKCLIGSIREVRG